MASKASVVIHPSQFPGQVRRDLLDSLLSRKINHKFHYDSIKQTLKWLALHEAYSPSRMDPDCSAIYDAGFEFVASRHKRGRVHLIGLGCGGGQKDARLLKLLQESVKEVSYTPADVSTAMVLVARQAALEIIPERNCFPLVCDLATAEDLDETIGQIAVSGSARIITFFGMLPNFEQTFVLSRLAGLVRRADFLLLSANLAPGKDYAAGVNRILPLYDNPLTRDWLTTFLIDIGIQKNDGKILFSIENDPSGTGLKRVTAYFRFVRKREIEVYSERFVFDSGDRIQLFFSYRHTVSLVRSLLAEHRLKVLQAWLTRSEEECVFLAVRA
jgi:uncharacterized SAM-dependent methyltransferase